MIACPVCLGQLVLLDEDGRPLSGMERLCCPCGSFVLSAMNSLPPRPGEGLECPQWRLVRRVSGSGDRHELVQEDGRLWERYWQTGFSGDVGAYEEVKPPRKRLRAVASLVRDILAQEVLES